MKNGDDQCPACLNEASADCTCDGIMKVECAWCKVELGYKDAKGSGSTITSGICKKCFERMKP